MSTNHSPLHQCSCSETAPQQCLWNQLFEHNSRDSNLFLQNIIWLETIYPCPTPLLLLSILVINHFLSSFQTKPPPTNWWSMPSTSSVTLHPEALPCNKYRNISIFLTYSDKKAQILSVVIVYKNHKSREIRPLFICQGHGQCIISHSRKRSQLISQHVVSEPTEQHLLTLTSLKNGLLFYKLTESLDGINQMRLMLQGSPVASLRSQMKRKEETSKGGWHVRRRAQHWPSEGLLGASVNNKLKH